MAFHVGQKVVCVPYIGGRPRLSKAGYGDEAKPKVGSIYTVRGFDPDGHDGPSLWVEEIVNPVHPYLWYDGSIRVQECSWAIANFKPLIERTTETGMAILREILERETVKDAPRAPVKIK